MEGSAFHTGFSYFHLIMEETGSERLSHLFKIVQQ